MNSNWSIILGFWFWIGISFWLLPSSMLELNYVQILILAAPLWLIPIVLKQSDFSENIQLFSLPCAVALAVSFLFEKGNFAGMLTSLWLVFTLFLGWKKLLKLFDNQSNSIPNVVECFAYLFLPIGAIWVTCDRIDFQPLDFTSTIILLTAAHFHYAGFLLLIVASQILKFQSILTQKIIGIGLILGMPLVAIGITTTHYNLPNFIEIFGVSVMALSAIGVGILHFKIGWKYRTKAFGMLWILGGCAIIFGMILALAYGWRIHLSLTFLTIPWMYAIHGTLNAIGFAIPCVLGWHLSRNFNLKN